MDVETGRGEEVRSSCVEDLGGNNRGNALLMFSEIM
jgi:hypothetical protein